MTLRGTSYEVVALAASSYDVPGGPETRSPGTPARRTLDAVDDAQQQVVGRFVQDGRLVIVPTKRSKLLLVLDHLAQSFEPGRKYSEPEVNEVLGSFHEDVAALRRYLVDEGFLSREGGVYWRSGGTVEV